MSPIERAFLTRLASMKQGRCSYGWAQRDLAIQIAHSLIHQGYVKERRQGFNQGFQITDKGREYLGGLND